MNSKEIVKAIMKKKEYTYELLAKKLKCKHTSQVSNRLITDGELRVDTLIKFLTEMDYELVIRSTNKKDEFVVSLDVIENE